MGWYLAIHHGVKALEGVKMVEHATKISRQACTGRKKENIHIIVQSISNGMTWKERTPVYTELLATSPPPSASHLEPRPLTACSWRGSQRLDALQELIEACAVLLDERERLELLRTKAAEDVAAGAVESGRLHRRKVELTLTPLCPLENLLLGPLEWV